jgi:hypothetical protein
MSFPTFTWPNWRREAKQGQRFRNTQTGATGTFIKPSPNRHNGAIVIWDVPNGRPPFRDDGKPVNAVGFATWAEPELDPNLAPRS